jgi:hypothetical protein
VAAWSLQRKHGPRWREKKKKKKKKKKNEETTRAAKTSRRFCRLLLCR